MYFYSHNFYFNCVNLHMPFSSTCIFKLCLVKFLPQFYLHWLICFIKYNMQYTFSTHLVLSRINISDKLATIQRGAVCTFSQDPKIYTCLHIYIYIIYYLWIMEKLWSEQYQAQRSRERGPSPSVSENHWRSKHNSFWHQKVPLFLYKVICSGGRWRSQECLQITQFKREPRYHLRLCITYLQSTLLELPPHLTYW